MVSTLEKLQLGQVSTEWSATAGGILSGSKGILVRLPVSVGGSVGAGYYQGVAVGVAHPAFPVIGAAVSIFRVSVFWQDEFDTHFYGAMHDGFEIFYLKPEEHAVAVGLVAGVADPAVIMFGVEAVQLKDQLPVQDQLFVVWASVIALAAEETLVPAAACFHVGDSD
jgi:hypothetical protein